MIDEIAELARAAHYAEDGWFLIDLDDGSQAYVHEKYLCPHSRCLHVAVRNHFHVASIEQREIMQDTITRYLSAVFENAEKIIAAQKEIDELERVKSLPDPREPDPHPNKTDWEHYGAWRGQQKEREREREANR